MLAPLPSSLMASRFWGCLCVVCCADAYRNAVALNPRDYRAWYGLGQTYELLSMPHYALHYYRWALTQHTARSSQPAYLVWSLHELLTSC